MALCITMQALGLRRLGRGHASWSHPVHALVLVVIAAQPARALLISRNIFEGKKYVEEYRTQDVASELGMSRDKLIQLALLLGSDYTEGVAGIGIVNAFPTEELLVNFRYKSTIDFS